MHLMVEIHLTNIIIPPSMTKMQLPTFDDCPLQENYEIPPTTEAFCLQDKSLINFVLVK